MTSRLLAHWTLVALVAAAGVRLLVEAVVEIFPARSHRSLRVVQQVTGYLVLLLGAAFVLASRFPTWTVHSALNPDEAQMTANALLVRAGHWTWSGIDGATSGPPNAIVLAWPYLFGMDATLSTTRLTSTVLLIAILFLTYGALRHTLSSRSALLCVLPAFLFVGGTTHTDFVHYSSEQTPLLLMMPGAWVCMRPLASWRGALRFVPYLAAFCLGLVPFAKLQVTPLALVAMAGLILRAMQLPEARGKRTAIVLLLLSCAALPSVLFLGPLVLGDELHHFANSYIRWAGVYVGTPLEASSLIALAKADPVFYGLAACFTVAVAAWLVLLAFVARRVDAETATQWGFSFLLFAAACWAVAKPGRHYPHYLYLLVPTGLLASGVLLAVVQRSARHNGRLTLAADAVLFAATVGFLMPPVVDAAEKRPYGTHISDRVRVRTPSILEWLGPKPNDALHVWGWMPQWYALAGIRPATRETHTEAHIKATPMREYFRGRLLADFDRSRPAFVLDAVARGSFLFEHADTDGIHSFPPLAARIQTDYVRIGDPASTGQCPRLYVRRERWSLISARLAGLARATATATYAAADRDVGPHKLLDNALFETCDDFWLLPDGAIGSATVELAARTDVRRVLVLNTGNGRFGDRASLRARINAVRDGQTIAVRETELAPFPEWTSLDLQASDVESVRVDILSFRGKGGGLNEIKVFRQ